MSNGYFKLVKTTGGCGVKLFPPTDGGGEINLLDLVTYLDKAQIGYDIGAIKKAAVEQQKEYVVFLSTSECPAINEEYVLEVSEDAMTAVVRFIPPTETGKRMTFDDFISDFCN